ncbi:DUF2182 domain-containing protein [Paraburkholderia azotifigens]|uniref:DUF2182 domain-containing protein n=2 Tax=Paraburkholderia azotifigens TaxID=2057004 RepID=A0ABU9QTZ6_9BURK|nr:DUF2182 domain-containing protein [Paraburkholderia azotifigens]
MKAACASLAPLALRHSGMARISQRRLFFGVLALVFATCAGLTIVWCLSMSTMPELPMPGGWTLSMTWAPMCGQKWPRIAVSFVGMWIVMMVAMMLPSLAPALWRYHEALDRRGAASACRSTALMGMGYFVVWAVLGAVVFALSFTFVTLAIQRPALSRAVPVAAGVVVLMAGASQFSAWKARYLACSRAIVLHGARSAYTHGMRHGMHCVGCCAGLTAVLVVNGVMDLRTMALVTLAISAERLASAPERMARAIGIVIVVLGLSMLARAFVFL